MSDPTTITRPTSWLVKFYARALDYLSRLKPENGAPVYYSVEVEMEIHDIYCLIDAIGRLPGVGAESRKALFEAYLSVRTDLEDTSDPLAPTEG